MGNIEANLCSICGDRSDQIDTDINTEIENNYGAPSIHDADDQINASDTRSNSSSTMSKSSISDKTEKQRDEDCNQIKDDVDTNISTEIQNNYMALPIDDENNQTNTSNVRSNSSKSSIINKIQKQIDVMKEDEVEKNLNESLIESKMNEMNISESDKYYNQTIVPELIVFGYIRT
eukprot:224750_1